MEALVAPSLVVSKVEGADGTEVGAAEMAEADVMMVGIANASGVGTVEDVSEDAVPSA